MSQCLVHQTVNCETKSFSSILTDHGLYAVAHQHRQEAMVGGSAGAVDDVGKLGRPLQMDN